MDIQTEKIRIAQTIPSTDDAELIQAVNVLLKKAGSEEIIGSKPDGTPLTQRSFWKAWLCRSSRFKKVN